MKHTLLLIAGYPGTGKSYLMNLLCTRFSYLHKFSPDEIKEKNWDIYGFDSLEEKEKLIEKSWCEYFLGLEQYFKKKISVISDYPFSEKQKGKLEILTKRFHVQVITIRLMGDLDVLYTRQKQRDLSNTRHLGHILASYHADYNVNRSTASGLLSYDEFMNRCKTRGYDSFCLGKLFEVDVTDYSKVNYELLIKKLSEIIDS